MSGPRPEAPEESALSALLSALRRALLGSASDSTARREWCDSQREKLGAPGGPVVWVRKDSVAWAEWGAGRGYFALERMDGLAYLRAVGGG